ncbi:CoF synthetase, partial [Winogradskyella sp.]
FFSSKSNYQVGNHLVYIKIWNSKFDFMTRYGFIMKNIYAYSVFNLSDDEIDHLISHLNKNGNPISFIGYASAFEKICHHLDDLESNPIKFKTKSLITISEALNFYTKDAIQKYFGIRPLSRYSNNENGIIAQQTKDSGSKFRVNDSSYVVEIFDLKKDKKLDYGQLGRIVITDLFNKATPIIRYDTGDVGTLELNEDGRPYFSEIYGRKLDLLYDTKGKIVPSHLSAKLVKYGDFKQFQLVQKGLKDYEVNLNTDKKIDEEALIAEYRGYFGDDANIKINYVDEIPLLASGKRREVVNEYYA